MTSKAEFTKQEWEALAQLPRWIVAAASAAEQDAAHRTHLEVESGMIATAKGRESSNAFLAEIAADALWAFDDRATLKEIDFTDRDAGIEKVLDRVIAIRTMLAAKADPGELARYGQWLLSITDVVISAARTGDVLGYGGQRITEAEKRFRDRLASALQNG